MREYFGRLMEYAEAARWGKKRITREAARARTAELAADVEFLSPRPWVFFVGRTRYTDESGVANEEWA